MTELVNDNALAQAVDGFYRREILLLQDRRYREWLALLDPSIDYRVPVTHATLGGLVPVEDGLGYYDENLELLKARVAKLESKMSWVEQPPSRLRYFVQTIEVGRTGHGTVSARSNLLLLQYRWNMEQQFSGERTDTLVEEQGGLKLRKRLVVLDRQALGKQGLSVFF
ncbi:aromatic-ring-hydroxylating dioxygenase subunit beta [Ramlibacter sp. AW1]|uniref:Aromatic-ring-hydroxylating dioxygenase subunit beta n=1 Tax=Ramlibacter aurantiacus TaxID=2801330 RepID=A0A936ZKJ9_9BURK|nr:aromatic-ring-hydroxylating dioxygenase subunit beta [Ramlibacter aurantiacus]MBL0423039.1 aromatic-ring-hydroxylating dioxygenase subunit beta [Ramlibacter aurantiacus]